MNQKVKINDLFMEWFKQTNPHLYRKKVTKKFRDSEIEEYVNDVLQEHMETMECDFSTDSEGEENI